MKAVIYTRVSSSGYQESRQNVERQVADLQRYADFASMEVVRVFEEHMSGGKKNSERPVLIEAMDYCKEQHVGMILVSELSRLGRNAFEVLATVKDLQDNGINLYMDKEQFTLLDKDGKPSMFAPVMLATLSTCAELERQNIAFRLASGRAHWLAQGGVAGRPKGSTKSKEQKREQYKEELSYLRRGFSAAITAKLTGTSLSTIKRLKKEFSI